MRINCEGYLASLHLVAFLLGIHLVELSLFETYSRALLSVCDPLAILVLALLDGAPQSASSHFGFSSSIILFFLLFVAVFLSALRCVMNPLICRNWRRNPRGSRHVHVEASGFRAATAAVGLWLRGVFCQKLSR